jgi:sugar phosphate isomerase/epimerase
VARKRPWTALAAVPLEGTYRFAYNHAMPYTRREFAALAAALPATCLLPATAAAQAPVVRPNSKWAGVQVGLNVPYNYGNNNMPIDQVLANTVALGVSAVELRGQPIEAFLGAPPTPPNPSAGREPGPEAVAAAAALRAWRSSASLQKAEELRRTFDTAGVLIEIVKWDGVFRMSDAELDYIFQLSKALGAKALSTEIGAPEQTSRVGQFADRHQLFIGYHGHASTGVADYVAPFASAKFNGANVDIGHFVAGSNTSPAPFIAEHAARITHLHIKDRRRNNGPNTAFGGGDTPIREILQMMRDRKFTFQATVEFEYPIPAGSTRMAEMAKALDYCRSCLVS